MNDDRYLNEEFTVTKEEQLKTFDIEVAKNIFEHISEITNAYLENIEKIFTTYKAEMALFDASMVLGFNACHKQIIVSSFGVYTSITNNLRELNKQINDRNGKSNKKHKRHKKKVSA